MSAFGAPRSHKQSISSSAAPAGGVFIDAITERHISTDPNSLLQRRCLTHSKSYGWTYDVWVDDPAKYALTGANSRFSLPAIVQRVAGMVSESTQAVGQQIPQQLQRVQQRPQQ